MDFQWKVESWQQFACFSVSLSFLAPLHIAAITHQSISLSQM